MTGGRPGPLLARARRALRSGPLPTAELAREVMALQGTAGAVEGVIRWLLDGHPEFERDAAGRWHLREGRQGAGPLLDRDYAVVDVETTGGGPRKGDRVTEISVVPVTGGTVHPPFSSLVDPGRPIPRRIQALTGITDEMVAGAPAFSDIAPTVLGLLEERVFVAHNARFDWSFVDEELRRADRAAPDVERLCTVRMSRRLCPELRRHNLDQMVRHFELSLRRRHRAADDARATAHLLLRLLERAAERGAGDRATLDRLLSGARSGKKARRKGRPSPALEGRTPDDPPEAPNGGHPTNRRSP